MHDEIAISEAEIFGRYIVGVSPSSEAAKRYARMVHAAKSDPTDSDLKIIRFVHAHPRLLPAIDAYCALFLPDAEIRRRLYIMFAVLETVPEYSRYFIARKHGGLYWFVVAGIALRAIYRVYLGFVIMQFIGAKR